MPRRKRMRLDEGDNEKQGPSGINRKRLKKEKEINLIMSFWEKYRCKNIDNVVSWNKAYNKYCEVYMHITFVEFRKATTTMAKEAGLAITKAGVSILRVELPTHKADVSMSENGKHKKMKTGSKGNLDSVRVFINRHYEATEEQNKEVTLATLFQHFLEQNKRTMVTYEEFVKYCSRNTNIEIITRGRSRVTTIKMKPKSKECYEFHQRYHVVPTETAETSARCIIDILSTHFGKEGMQLEVLPVTTLFHFYQ